MGCWLGAFGRLIVYPEPDEQLLRDYVYFSSHTCPKGYREDEIFGNSWFFDYKNRLISGIGKFAEPMVWYDHLKDFFFAPRGYRLYGDPEYVGEGEIPGIGKLGEEREVERIMWEERVCELFKEKKQSEEEPETD